MNNLETAVAIKPHPFKEIPSNINMENLLSQYTAMSVAFPYLQAGSQKDIIFDVIENNLELPKDVKLTTAVANYLCFDEIGGFLTTVSGGYEALPCILDIKRSHGELLIKNCKRLLGDSFRVQYSKPTKDYLKNLFDGLSHKDPVIRVASMSSFEHHADIMITALWESVADYFDVEKDTLSYFRLHVGGHNPAEPYHCSMTQKLFDKIIDKSQHKEFNDCYKKQRQLHVDWCQDIIDNSLVN